MAFSCKRHYWNIREHLTIDDGFIVYGCRLLIPASMRQKVLANLHESHQGAMQTKERARLSLYWPGIDNNIDNVILLCKKCQDHLPSNCKEPIMSKPKPSQPFQEITVDFAAMVDSNSLSWMPVSQTARHYPNVKQHLHTALGDSVILPHCSSRHSVVRWWATIHLQVF